MPSPQQHLARRIHSHLHDHLLPFWCGPALDHTHGGWHACLSNDLTPDPSQPQGLIVNSRILWAFSAAHRAEPRPLYRQMAERALDIVWNRFWDSTHGGAFWRLDSPGNVLDDSKKTYGQAFYIYALAEYHLAFHHPPALERALHLAQLLEQHTHDPTHGGYLEVRQRDWSPAADLRLSDKDQNEAKSMNNHLHVLEAFTNLHRAQPHPHLLQRLEELLHLFRSRILDPRTAHLHHFFNESWQVRSDTCTYGHDIEASWLLCEAAELLHRPDLLHSVQQLAVRMADVTLAEGIDPATGALSYEGRDGQVIDPGKECWPQAEAVVGFLNAWQLSQNPCHLDAAIRVWDFIENRLADRTHGEWFWRINEDGQPDLTLPKVSEWKGPYHGTRACLEAIRRLSAQTGQPHSTA